MSFQTEQDTENNRAIYRDLTAKALNLASQINAWEGTYSALFASVNATKQAELIAKREAFVNAIKASLGI